LITHLFSDATKGFEFNLYQGSYIIDVKKKRTIKEEEIGVSKYTTKNLSYFTFSQDEKYLLIGYLSENGKKNIINDLYIINIGSFADFFSGKSFKIEAVLHLNDFDFVYMMGLHINRSGNISVIGRF